MTDGVDRLDIRINARDKDRIARAAALRGMAVSAFVRSAVLRETDTAIAANTSAALSPAESRYFLATLDAPFEPDERLKKAMERAATLSGGH